MAIPDPTQGQAYTVHAKEKQVRTSPTSTSGDVPCQSRYRGPPGLLRMVAVLLTLTAAWAADRTVPRASAEPVPVVASVVAAQAVLEQARQSGQGLVADLTLGQEGQLVRAVSAEPLAPGRYRLHALIASTPRDHILTEAVALRLTAGAATNVFEPPKWFPESGKLAPVHLDVVVEKPGVLTLSADWLVGDTKLDRNKNKELAAARRAYLAQRQNALNQTKLKSGSDAAVAGATDDGLGEDQAAAEAPHLKPQPLAGNSLPTYRLVLCGLVLERLSPVAVVAVLTDKAAYEPAATGRVTAELRNTGAEPVSAKLAWTMEDDARPGEIVVRHEETVKLAAGETREQTLTDTLATAGIRRLGRVRVEAAVEGLRADAARTPFVILPERPATPPNRPKKVYAHYMGCYPAGTGPTRYHRLNAGNDVHHDRGDDVSRRGGRFRNFDLVPPEPGLTFEESADLEIRRALRIGIDGFAIDAWAGGDGAKQVFEALIKVAAEKNYPFEVTICLDDAGPGDVRSLLEKHGQNPKLARRDGKPLIFTYFSHGKAMGTLYAEIDPRTPDSEREAAVSRLRATELGWHLIGQSFRKAEEQVGQPVYFTYDLIYFFHNVPKELILPGMQTRAAAAIARHVPMLASFGTYGFGYGDKLEDIAQAVRDTGAEWGGPGGMHQKENILPGGGELFMPKGTEWLRGVWDGMIRDQASLIQLITWNDYTENTNLAPGYNTRYTVYDLTGYFIDWWRKGEPPAVERDRVYLTSAKYPKDAKSWPFTIRERRDRALEVLTLLTAPATVRLPGRDLQYDAPAGLHAAQLPLTPGPVIVEIVRNGKIALRLESPEPITERPFREENSMACWSTEEQRHWQADFGDRPMFVWSEYGDADNDGLPNWFEMYWFSKERGFQPKADDTDMEEAKPFQHSRWPDFSTATLADPKSDPARTGKTLLQHYRDRTDPTQAAAPGTPGAATDMDK